MRENLKTHNLPFSWGKACICANGSRRLLLLPLRRSWTPQSFRETCGRSPRDARSRQRSVCVAVPTRRLVVGNESVLVRLRSQDSLRQNNWLVKTGDGASTASVEIWDNGTSLFVFGDGELFFPPLYIQILNLLPKQFHY